MIWLVSVLAVIGWLGAGFFYLGMRHASREAGQWRTVASQWSKAAGHWKRAAQGRRTLAEAVRMEPPTDTETRMH